MDHHQQSFFGQKTGVLLNSAQLHDPFLYLQFLGKKPSGQWEKPSLKEGKNIKINLLELIHMIRVFSTHGAKWSTVHKFGEENTSITIENKCGAVTFFVAGYSKYFKFPETKLFGDLLHHIYTEKIVHATGGLPPSQSYSDVLNPTAPNLSTPIPSAPSNKDSRSHHIQQLRDSPIEYSEELDRPSPVSSTITPSMSPSFTPEEWFEALQQKEEFRLVPGDIIRTSGKALAFQILGHNEIWVPNSCVTEANDPSLQGLWIKEWFLKKKMEDIFSTPVN